MIAIQALALLSALSHPALAETNSDRYRWLETADQKQTDFIQSHNAAVDSREQSDPNFTAIEYWQFQAYDTSRELKRVSLDSTHALILRENGLGKSTDLVFDSPDGESVLVSDSQSANPPVQNLVTFGVSPDKATAWVLVEQNGSIDQMQILLLDLKAQAVLPQQFVAAEEAVAWTSSTELIFESIDAQNNRFLTRTDIKSGATKTYSDGGLDADGDRYVAFEDGENLLLHDKIDQTDIAIQCKEAQKILLEDESGAVLYCQGEHDMGELRRFDKASASTPQPSASGTPVRSGTALVGESDKPIDNVQSNNGALFVTVRNGADRWLRVYDSTGKQAVEIPVPDCCSISAIHWDVPGKTLLATLVSSVGSSNTFVYRLATSSWNRDPATLLEGTDGVQYKTEIIQAKSKDGTQIPVRLDYRADLVRDGTHPVYFRSYGGFDLSGYLDPAYKADNQEYLRRGGILAGPALRGGNEFGPAWHKAAMFDKKITTYQDLAAAAEEVVKEGWTKPSLIISTGTSNGGLTVSATALLFPQDFGLVIPIAGVDDFLGKERLDPANQGWDEEYGDATDPNMLPSMTAVSPVENARNLGSQHFLIVDGLSDTRVNHVHSLKLQAAIEELGGSAGWSELASFQAAGHALASYPYQNTISWHVNSLIWTAIFNQAGWKW